MSEPETDVAITDPVRRGLVAYAETINERDRLKRELDDCQLRLSQEQARAAGLEHDLRRAEISADGAKVERDAAIRETAKYETFFEAVGAMMREFRPGPKEGDVFIGRSAGRIMTQGEADALGRQLDARYGAIGYPSQITDTDGNIVRHAPGVNGSATPAGDTAASQSETKP